jgi:hypothetical protein
MNRARIALICLIDKNQSPPFWQWLHRLRLCMLLLASGLLAGCAQPYRSPEAVSRTYDEARVSIPKVVVNGKVVTPGHFGFMVDAGTQTQLTALASAGVRLPVVVYMHGCTGFERTALYDSEYISSLGAIVVAPDSYARIGRPSACDPTTRKHGGPVMWQMRFEEIGFARDRLEREPWADTARVVLFGFSEGGFAVAGTQDNRFIGYIATGANCNAPGYNLVGLRIPKGKPVLLIRSSDDPWQYSFDVCDRDMPGRPNSISVLIPKHGHYFNSEDYAKDAIRTFLRGVIGPPRPDIQGD